MRRSRKVREGGRLVNKALVIAHGVHETGRREILSIDVGEAETEAFWTDFLRGRVHFLRDCLGHARRDQHGLLAALIRLIFAGPTPVSGVAVMGSRLNTS
jgi:transposase-like protein